MNSNDHSDNSVGYLIVKVSTARGAIPLSGALVNIRGGSEDDSGVLYSLRTDRDGQTEKVSLPTPPKSLSESPSNLAPYKNYNVNVSKDGYVPLLFQNVPIFPSIVSIQPAVMIPLPQDPDGQIMRAFPSTVISEDEQSDL